MSGFFEKVTAIFSTNEGSEEQGAPYPSLPSQQADSPRRDRWHVERRVRLAVIGSGQRMQKLLRCFEALLLAHTLAACSSKCTMRLSTWSALLTKHKKR